MSPHYSEEPMSPTDDIVGTALIGMLLTMVIAITWSYGLIFWVFGAVVVLLLFLGSFVVGAGAILLGRVLSKALSRYSP